MTTQPTTVAAPSAPPATQPVTAASAAPAADAVAGATGTAAISGGGPAVVDGAAQLSALTGILVQLTTVLTQLVQLVASMLPTQQGGLPPSPPSTPTPVTPTPTTPPTSAQVGMPQIVSPAAGDDALIQSVMTAAAGSSTAKSVLDRAVASGAKVKLLSGAELADKISGGAVASYHDNDDTIYLNRDEIRASPQIAAAQIAHESVHFLHDAEITARKNTIAQQMASWPAAQRESMFNRALAEVTIASEVEAYMVDARVGTEFGLKPNGHPALNADGSFRTRQQTWEALTKIDVYNPTREQGLTPSWITKVLPA